MKAKSPAEELIVVTLKLDEEGTVWCYSPDYNSALTHVSSLGHPWGSWYTTNRDYALALAMKNHGKRKENLEQIEKRWNNLIFKPYAQTTKKCVFSLICFDFHHF